MAPRYSIIRGDFPSDQRADVGHFRVYTLIGRHTDEHGWCRLKQITIGDAVGLSRKTVNLKITDLVEWGYVEKNDTDATGRAIWYRTIMDAPFAPPRAADEDDDGDCETPDGPVTSALHVGCNSATTCNPIEVTPGVTHRVTPGVTTGSNTERPLLNDQVPQPHGASATGLSGKSDLIGKAERFIAEVRAAGVSQAVAEILLRPILEQRRFSAADRSAELIRLARSADGLPVAALKRAAELVLDLGIATIKPQRIADAIAKVRSGGAMVPIRRGTPQWHRWLEHFGQVDAHQARTMDRFDVWQVPSEWPPAAAVSERGAA